MAGDFQSCPKGIETEVKKVVADLLDDKSEALDLDKSFLELGINSILSVELVEALEQRFEIQLGIEVIFDYRGIKELAEFILDRYGADHMSKHCQNEPAACPSCTETGNPDLLNHKESAKVEVENNNRNVSLPGEWGSNIAVIGISGKFAGSETIEEFWDHLEHGDSCIEQINRKGWDERNYYDPYPDRKNKSISKWGGLLKNIDSFDASFFNISPLEAERMDPQQRLFLEEGYKSIEDAGYSPEQLSGKKVGVFVGGRSSDYKEKTLMEEEINAQTFLGNDMSILAARLSYFLNLKGPSMAVDTACSSSLIAIHSACGSIRRGESEIALAGGVFAISSPEFYIMTSKTNMLSPDGKCKTFDNSANGIVLGEGVGVLVLKPLKAAIEDRDNIYGVIKGTAVNQDGKTKGITAPSMLSQKELIFNVYKNASIHPETVSYIEAHGTGTKLGDPIEIKALTEAFRMFTDKTKFCAIGSHKPNFGHTIMSAGIAGVLKILMAMKYRKIPPTINITQINEHIDLNGSPFFVNTRLMEWENRGGIPLRAGVSSFGFSGTNCHVIIEEAPIQKRCQDGINRPYYLFLISAKTKKALSRKISDMAKWIDKEAENYLIEDITYTLLTGRSHFPVRCAFIAKDLSELKQRIREINEKGTAEEYFQNEENDSLKMEKVLEPILREYGERLIKELQEPDNLTWNEYKEKLLVLSNLYIKGCNLNWEDLFINCKTHRIALPAYPFAGESYWITETGNRYIKEDHSVSIHPLLHKNTSNFSEQRFSTFFTGREFFLADHVVKGERILPGVVYLEMARAATAAAVDASEEDKTGLQLKNVVWIRPVVVRDKPVLIHISLLIEENGEISYKIYSGNDGDSDEIIEYCQGSVAPNEAVEPQLLDIEALKAECNLGSFSASECYDAFKAMGADYGMRLKGIEKVYVGEDKLLTKISLPEAIYDTQDMFDLHPSLMDSAVQICLMMGSGDMKSFDSKSPRNPLLPFALQSLEIIDKLAQKMWAYVRYSDGSGAKHEVQKFDIDLCDEKGFISVRMKGFCERVLEGEVRTKKANETSIKHFPGTMMLTPAWDIVPIKRGKTFPSFTDRVVVIEGTKDKQSAIQQYYPQAQVLDIHPNDTIEEIYKKFKDYGSFEHIIWIAPHRSLDSLADDLLVEEQKKGVIPVFRIIKALLRLGYGEQNLGWTVITTQTQSIGKNDIVNPTHASLHGLVGSMAKEYPNWQVRLVDVEDDCQWPINDIFTLSADSQGELLVYRDKVWYRQKLVSAQVTELNQPLYRQDGIYVVIGGAGGIAEVWTEYMIRNYQAQVIWLGRREEDESIRMKINKLAALGPKPYYISADATDEKALAQAYKEIKMRHPRIHGVIDSAIVLLDGSLANIDEARFKATLSAKVDLSVRIAQVFQKEELDFVMFFSSVNSFLKSAGQSNYVSGCTFKDAFARQLSLEWDCAVKVMNWGYWGNVGIVASDHYKDKMVQLGIGSIEPQEAMEALETLMAGQLDQLVFLKTTKNSVFEELNLHVDTEEWIAAYPENIPSNIYSLQERIKTVPLPKLFDGRM
ncbi:6-deoxyerythronolide-B synthase [Ruminiclostridium papyrosolvens DSM 2782]|uniref:6-deoxyerythronolide-B synthase n=1 Tax=Ruminiclostridium papyrosolvens DSM 2782 TaxID=588581 RepID=F1TAA4_9FIRM|nr:type I polyketide synthase [Ruminiclostridium papyrosolvens]EGD48846.1 6-deoxyerythronolide-B synthase [Ruminiclostridium papyrosolvens DSM 2782]WES32400.1 type I polyketide synthase [Ruminiclostridium papyrosolvens DSM 2782]